MIKSYCRSCPSYWRGSPNVDSSCSLTATISCRRRSLHTVASIAQTLRSRRSTTICCSRPMVDRYLPSVYSTFDTVDHALLIDRLERQFGLRDNVLEWFRSYLSDRTFRVVYGGNTSRTVVIFCSVPQGSVLGPRLFILYIGDLADEIDRHGVSRRNKGLQHTKNI